MLNVLAAPRPLSPNFCFLLSTFYFPPFLSQLSTSRSPLAFSLQPSAFPSPTAAGQWRSICNRRGFPPSSACALILPSKPFVFCGIIGLLGGERPTAFPA